MFIFLCRLVGLADGKVYVYKVRSEGINSSVVSA